MVYLLGVMWVAVTLGRGPAVLASILSVAAFDFFFVPPNMTFAVSDTQYLVTFGVMLLAAILIGTLAARLQAQVQVARIGEHRADALAKLSGELVALQDREHILAAALRHLEDVFESRAVVLLPDDNGRLSPSAGDVALLGPDAHERGVAQWAFDAGQPAGLGTDTLPGSKCLHLPLRGSRRQSRRDRDRSGRDPPAHGAGHVSPVAGVRQPHRARARARRACRAGRAGARSERDRKAAQRTAQLRLARSADTTRRDHRRGVDLARVRRRTRAAVRREMLKSVADEASRLNRLVGNLLAMTRLEAGALEVKRSWHSLEEIVGAALHRIEPLMENRPVRIEIPRDLPLIAVDDVLLEQVVFNLVENALKHAPDEQPIEIRARASGDEVEVSVADRGPGLPPGIRGSRVREVLSQRDIPSHRRCRTRARDLPRASSSAHGGTLRGQTDRAAAPCSRSCCR